MTPTRIVPSPYGDVKLGVFNEVLSIPGRYLNDHCLIRHAGLWHMFGITGSVDDPTRLVVLVQVARPRPAHPG